MKAQRDAFARDKGDGQDELAACRAQVAALNEMVESLEAMNAATAQQKDEQIAELHAKAAKAQLLLAEFEKEVDCDA